MNESQILKCYYFTNNKRMLIKFPPGLTGAGNELFCTAEEHHSRLRCATACTHKFFSVCREDLLWKKTAETEARK